MARTDLRRNECYSTKANLTPEEAEWVKSQSAVQRLQSGKRQLKHGFFALLPARPGVDLSQQRFINHRDVVGVSLFPVKADNVDRRICLQLEVNTFDSDEGGSPCFGSQAPVFETDAGHPPRQHHPFFRLVDFDPTRGEVKEEYDPESIGALVERAKGTSHTLCAPVAGQVDRTERDGWVTIWVGDMPIYRFPSTAGDRFELVKEPGDQVEKDDPLVTLSGEGKLSYRRTEFVNGTPDIDEHRLLSPLAGEYRIVEGELRHDVVVNAGGRNVVLYRFHAADVADGKVEFSSERNIRGTRQFRFLPRHDKHAPKYARYAKPRLRRYAERMWRSLVGKDTEGEHHLVVKLVGAVDYAQALFRDDRKPWIDFIHAAPRAGNQKPPGWNVMPASQARLSVPDRHVNVDLKAVFRTMNRMLAMMSQLQRFPCDHLEYPKVHPAEDYWPGAAVIFSQKVANELVFEENFQVSEELRKRIKQALSLQGDFAFRAQLPEDRGEKWKLTGLDEGEGTSYQIFRFKPMGELGDDEESEDSVEAFDLKVPDSMIPRDGLDEGSVIRVGQVIADWLPRRNYKWDELVEALGDNLFWLVSAFLKEECMICEEQRGWQGKGVLVDSMLVRSVEHLKHDWMLDLENPEKGVELTPDGALLFSPLHHERDSYQVFVNGIAYDFTPPVKSPDATERREPVKKDTQEARKVSA